MKCTQQQIADIIKNNPNKCNVDEGKKIADKLMLHIQGKGMDKAILRCDYFENTEIYAVRKKYAVSNKDLYGRLLQQEDMVFTAKGGSSIYNLPESKEKQLSGMLDSIRYGMSLRKWIKDFALQAYRSDPMGILFMEIDKAGDGINPRAYPTYKSIYSIYDYLPTGRILEYVCFRLNAKDARAFGIIDSELASMTAETMTDYYRFVDDAFDYIQKWTGDNVEVVGDPIPNPWGQTPSIMNSNLIDFMNPLCFYSPVHLTIELADCFLNDRSVRDLQKKLHGFAKAVEPLMDCGECEGEKYVNGVKCTTCKGTGYKQHTKVSDVARFPLDLLEKNSFDFKKIFGYVTPDIEGWEKQDTSLRDLEDMIEQTYWGTSTPRQTNGPVRGGNLNETATKTLSDLQPRYARLNMTADWAEKTEMHIVDFIGRYSFPESFKKSTIAYGRYYILETPADLWDLYERQRGKGAPEATLYETLEKYYHSLYLNSPIELAVHLKLLYVEPFPHLNVMQLKAIATSEEDINCKLYFGEWYSGLSDIYIIRTKTEELRAALRTYVVGKNLPPAPVPVTPGFGK